MVLKGNFLINSQTKFLGILLDSTLQWKGHIELITPKLCASCYVLRTLSQIMSKEVLVMVCFSYFHSIMSYTIIFWGTSAYSNNVFKLQKRAIRLITNSDTKEPCRKLFRQLNILTFYSQYIFSIICVVIKNDDIYVRNVDIHSRNTTNNFDFHITPTNLAIHQKSTYYMGRKIFNSLPSYIKEEIHNVRKFRRLLKHFLYCKNFYTLDEYFDYKEG
jgi:hypothetical protein